ncbi:MAG: PrgI family protein [Oscillospiraceae bacterium]|nr:PrgI family protein [Oscillospiraceae bacterium]
MENITIIIPANFTEAGRILGVFELRKLVECVLLSVPLLFFFLFVLPFSVTVNIVLATVIVVPVGGFAIIGIHDYSLLNFLRVYRKWRKSRGVIKIS